MGGKAVFLALNWSTVLTYSSPNADDGEAVDEKAKHQCDSSLVAGGAYEVPTDGKLVCRHGNYLTAYNPDYKAPLWSAYHITPDNVGHEHGGRRSFKPDPAIPEEHQEPLHSKCWGTEWNRGHLCPSYIMSFDKKPNGPWDDTYYITNTAMQYGHFNQGPWVHLEQHVAQWIKKNDKALHIVTGTVFNKSGITRCDLDTGEIIEPETNKNSTSTKLYSSTSSSGKKDADDHPSKHGHKEEPTNWMAVPDYYFKMLCDVAGHKSIAYYGHNRKDDSVLAITVADLEAKVGLKFWPDECAPGEKDEDYWFTEDGDIAMGRKKRQQVQAEDPVLYV